MEGSSAQLRSPIRSDTSPRETYPDQSSNRRGTDATSVGKILRRHWKLSATFAFVVIATVTAITFAMDPVYEPTSTIVIDPPGLEVVALTNPSDSNGAEYLETQAKLLRSDRLAVQVIRKLKLDKAPEFQRATLKPRPFERQDMETDPLHLTPSERAALEAFRRNLKVTRDTGSRIVTISFASSDPRLAATVTNTLVSEFIETSFTDRHKEIVQASEWLSKQLDDLSESMQQANKAVLDYQASTGIADVDEHKNTYTEQMDEMNRQLIQAKADRIQLGAYINNIKNGSAETFPQVADNPMIQQLTQKIADVRAQLSQARVIYGANHPNVKKLVNEENELRAQVEAQRAAIISGLKTRYDAALTRERMTTEQMKVASNELGQTSKYNTLKKDAQVKTELYNTLYARVKDAGIAAASKSMNIRVVDQAGVLQEPTKPRRALNLAFGVFAGLFGGVLVGFLRERFDTTIHTSRDIEKCTGIQSVCILPRSSSPATRMPLRLLGGNGLKAPEKFLSDRPNSPESEAVRGLHTSIMLSRATRKPQLILITSSFPQEGKTTVAVNLSIALASHSRTCLIDADLRRPAVARAFGITARPGLANLLDHSHLVEEVLVQPHGTSNLYVIPEGDVRGNPGELVSDPEMAEVISSLRAQFDTVVIDSPPIIPYVDGRALATFVDGIVLVGRAGTTTRDALMRSMELLREIHSAPIAEIVLNDTPIEPSEYRYYYDHARS